MNNKGFTLVESLMVVFIISILSISVIYYIGNTLSIDKKKAYEIFINNVESAAYDYMLECDNNNITCNYKWVDNMTSFSGTELINNGYFTDLRNPIDNSDLSNCLVINASRENGNVSVNVNVKCY